MAIRLSDAAAYLNAGDAGLRRAIANAHLVFFTGSQPSSANDSAGSSQPIISFTLDDGVYTPETRPQWSFVLSGLSGTAGLSSVKIDNFEILGATVTASDLGTLCDDIADQINSNVANLDFTASSDGSSTVTVTGPKGVGANMNSCILSATVSGTVTCTPSSSGAVTTTGVDAVNGLTLASPADGSGLSPAEEVFYLEKPSTEVWSGKNGFGPATAAANQVYTGIVDGSTYTAGWARLCASSGDDGLSATSGKDGFIRIDMSVGVSGTDIIMSPTASFVVNTTAGSEITTVLNSFRLKIAKKMG